MFDFNIFSKQVSDLRGQVNKIEEQIKEKKAEIHFLRTSPPPKSDLKNAIYGVFEVRADAAKTLIEESLEQWKDRALALGDEVRVAKGMHILNAQKPGVAPTPFSLECALHAIIGPQIKEGVARLIDELDWPAAGPALKERKALIAKAEGELEKLEAQLEEMRQSAASSGLLV